MAEIQYLDGNVNSPVLVHGPDPTNPDNVLVTRLAGSNDSVAKDTVTAANEDPTDVEDAEDEVKKEK